MLAKYGALLLAAYIAVVALAAQAEDAPKTNLPASRWSDDAEIIVPAPATITVPGRRCPAMWKVKRGESTLYVMATLTLLPSDASWDSACFKKLLPGLNQIIVLDGIQWWPADTQLLKGSTTLKQVVSAGTYDRWTATVARHRLLRAEAYEIYRPQWAGAFLLGAIFHVEGMRNESYPPYISYLAKEARVRIVKVYEPNPKSTINARNQLNAADAEVCLNTYFDLIDYDTQVLPVMAEAWGRGDMATVLRDYRELPATKCLPVGKEGEADAVKAQYVDAFVQPMDAALNQPGKSFAAVPLNQLLSKDGVLDQLKARGAEVVAAPPGVE